MTSQAVESFYPGPVPVPAPAPALSLDDVCFSYSGQGESVPALLGVSASFAAGTSSAIMGPSGCGKSTLLCCAAGLLTPDSGVVKIAGQPITGLSIDQLARLRRERVGFVFQSYNLVPSLSVGQNLGLPQRLAGKRTDRAGIGRKLQAVGLDGLAHRMPATLSGGQAQRAAVARALLTRPEVLFADEPTGALDSATGREVLDLMFATSASGTALVMVTHDARVASRADRVLFMYDGRLVEEIPGGSVDQVSRRLDEIERSGRR